MVSGILPTVLRPCFSVDQAHDRNRRVCPGRSVGVDQNAEREGDDLGRVDDLDRMRFGAVAMLGHESILEKRRPIGARV